MQMQSAVQLGSVTGRSKSSFLQSPARPDRVSEY